MTVAFYMDEHVPRAISVGLRLRGVDVLTAKKMGYETRLDSGIARSERPQSGVSFLHGRTASNILPL